MAHRILIVDDEAMITKSLQKLLKKQGYDVTIVTNGKEALEKIKNEDFDLFILDIRMPEMDGIETLQAARKIVSDSKKKPIPEIVITGYADEEKYKAAVELKVRSYIYKPFDTQEFLNTIQKVLNDVSQ
ncbi:MAG: response regulator [Candidatus Omnitrophica bacterium]|nr:response regulator [Candidatus Omnitrophota bacterium]